MTSENNCKHVHRAYSAPNIALSFYCLFIYHFIYLFILSNDLIFSLNLHCHATELLLLSSPLYRLKLRHWEINNLSEVTQLRSQDVTQSTWLQGPCSQPQGHTATLPKQSPQRSLLFSCWNTHSCCLDAGMADYTLQSTKKGEIPILFSALSYVKKLAELWMGPNFIINLG